MIIGVPAETRPGEARVALTPANVQALIQRQNKVLVEAGAGTRAGFSDHAYGEAGATIVDDRTAIFAQAGIIVQVLSFGANAATADSDLELLQPGQIVAGLMDPLGSPANAQCLADRGVTAIALELVPRISRAQSMDVLTSMASLAGYKAVLLGANLSPRIMPMMITAAGTLQPMRTFVMGAGVAGLQACATARRLGAVVEAYDVRPAAREQIISVGAKPVQLDIATEQTEDAGGYAREQGEDFLQKQREAMARVLAEQDLVITTAAVPGAKSPVLITAKMVEGMKPGAVIIDLAAERGGNCELTRLGETITVNGVTIYGPDNLAASIPNHASQMYGKNMEVLLSQILDNSGQLNLDFDDEVVAGVVIAHNRSIPHPRLRELLDLPAATEGKSDTAMDNSRRGEITAEDRN